jgi:hypothetical protein
MALAVLGRAAKKCFDGEGAVQADDDGADLFALLLQVLDGLEGGFGAGAHQDDDALGVGRADVVEGLVLAAGELGELVHRGCDDVGAGVVELVDGFAALEIDVGVLAVPRMTGFSGD